MCIRDRDEVIEIFGNPDAVSTMRSSGKHLILKYCDIELDVYKRQDIIRYKTTLRTNGAAMNKYIGQQFAALRYEKNILVVEETTSAGGCGSFLSLIHI